MSWFSSGSPVDTSSGRYKVCLHEAAHAVVAEVLGWRVTQIVIDDGADAGVVNARYRGSDQIEHDVQYATWLLAGPNASLRVAWFMPAGCDWDDKQARKALRRVRGDYGATKAAARSLVGRNWRHIQREARTLYLTGGR
ncbi:hypothetical protein [Pseudonocardia zijingensis]|uniref:Peptidase M41-like protein n=1 Tax=Pseudonocardia zijingensis TaxID=153376 RepID=A0ABN1NFR4_9PSEU